MRMPQKTGKWRAREILNRVRMAVECVGEIWKLPSNTSEPEVRASMLNLKLAFPPVKFAGYAIGVSITCRR